MADTDSQETPTPEVIEVWNGHAKDFYSQQHARRLELEARARSLDGGIAAFLGFEIAFASGVWGLRRSIELHVVVGVFALLLAFGVVLLLLRCLAIRGGFEGTEWLGPQGPDELAKHLQKGKTEVVHRIGTDYAEAGTALQAHNEALAKDVRLIAWWLRAAVFALYVSVAVLLTIGLVTTPPKDKETATSAQSSPSATPTPSAPSR